MTRGHPASFLTAAQAAALEPIWLIALNTDLSSPNDIFRYTTAEKDVVFPDSGDTYTARPYGQGVIRVETEGVSGMQVVMGDADDAIKTLIETTGAEFRQQTASLYRIERDLKTDATYAQRDDYVIDHVDPGELSVTFHLVPRAALFEREIPRSRITVQEFPGIVGQA